MKHTKGIWQRHNAPNGEHIWCSIEHIADFDGKNANGNAKLCVSSVNACISINPDNPQAVAEAIGDMYEALKEIENHATKYGGVPKSATLLWGRVRNIISKAEGR